MPKAPTREQSDPFQKWAHGRKTQGLYMVKFLKVKKKVTRRAMGEKRNTTGSNLIQLKLMLYRKQQKSEDSGG